MSNSLVEDQNVDCWSPAAPLTPRWNQTPMLWAGWGRFPPPWRVTVSFPRRNRQSSGISLLLARSSPFCRQPLPSGAIYTSLPGRRRSSLTERRFDTVMGCDRRHGPRTMFERGCGWCIRKACFGRICPSPAVSDVAEGVPDSGAPRILQEVLTIRVSGAPLGPRQLLSR